MTDMNEMPFYISITFSKKEYFLCLVEESLPAHIKRQNSYSLGPINAITADIGFF